MSGIYPGHLPPLAPPATCLDTVRSSATFCWLHACLNTVTVVCCAGSDAIRVEASQEVTCQDTLYLLEEITRQRYELTLDSTRLRVAYNVHSRYLLEISSRAPRSLADISEYIRKRDFLRVADV